MSYCDDLERWLDGSLDTSRAAVFKGHLPACDACREQIEEWSTVKEQFSDDVRTTEDIRPPDEDDARRFAAAVSARLSATGRPDRRFRSTIFWKAGLAAAAAVAVIGVSLMDDSATDSGAQQSRVRTAAPEQPTESMDAVPGSIVRTLANERREVTVSRSRVTLQENSEVAISQVSPGSTTLTLLQGTVSCEVQKRAPGSAFHVIAGDVTVTVVGTKFSVSRHPDGLVRVAVVEGIVQVQQGAQQRSLKAGDEWTLPTGKEILSSRTPEPALPKRSDPTVPIGADLEKWRALVVEGQLDEASAQIHRYLETSESDTRARMMLAGVERRQGLSREAISSCDRVIADGSPALANQARYLAAEISWSKLGDHNGAVRYLIDYLDNAAADAPNRAEAELHLSQSLLHLGRKAEARARLQSLVATYGRTPVADHARRLLKENP